MAEIYKLKVDTGAVDVPVEDERGNLIGSFPFIPGDTDILRRYEAMIDRLNEFIETLKQEHGENYSEYLAPLNDRIADEFDLLLNPGRGADWTSREQLFARCAPTTMTSSGDMLFETILEGISGIVEKVLKKRSDKKLKKIQAATSKYHK